MTKRLRIPKTAQEEYLKEQGFEVICGVDEVGRGAWAGPLVAAAVILPPAPKLKAQMSNVKRIYKIRDSKLLSAKEREKLSRKIKRTCVWGIGEVTAAEVDKWQLTKATQLAFKRAIEGLSKKVDFVLIDGTTPLLYPKRAEASRMGCRALKKGDMNCSSIAAASIIAKVYRDKIMRQLDRKIKGYYFSKHKGYGTKLHQERLKKLGPSPVHRKFYAPIKKALSNR